MTRRILFAALFVAFAGTTVLAASPRTVTWDDLVPKLEPVPDPFAHLTMNQRVELGLIASEREKEMNGFEPDDGRRGRLSARNLTRKLRAQGLDVEDLLAKYDSAKVLVAERGRMVVENLNDQSVRLAGYILPLEFSGTDVTEFLLVPYVGACIHVPPPPSNQIVYVRSREPFTSEDLYTAVWVTGRMIVASATKSLSLVDGKAPISTGYTMEADRIDAYKE